MKIVTLATGNNEFNRVCVPGQCVKITIVLWSIFQYAQQALPGGVPAREQGEKENSKSLLKASRRPAPGAARRAARRGRVREEAVPGAEPRPELRRR